MKFTKTQPKTARQIVNQFITMLDRTDVFVSVDVQGDNVFSIEIDETKLTVEQEDNIRSWISANLPALNEVI